MSNLAFLFPQILECYYSRMAFVNKLDSGIHNK